MGRCTTMHAASQKVKGVPYVAHMPTDADVRGVLGRLKDYAKVRQIALAAGISYRTLYRQLEPEPPDMDPSTRVALVALFDSLGLLEADAGYRTYIVAGDKIPRRAARKEAEAVARETVRVAKDRAIEEQGKSGGKGGSKKAKRK